jgi:hypothetical protein
MLDTPEKLNSASVGLGKRVPCANGKFSAMKVPTVETRKGPPFAFDAKLAAAVANVHTMDGGGVGGASKIPNACNFASNSSQHPLLMASILLK